MTDTHASFTALALHQREGTDFRIDTWARSSSWLVAAPHGGAIEPGTSEIARAVAAEDHALYLFEGIKARGNSLLHITSTRFDEPRGLALAAAAQRVLTIHGEASGRDAAFIGGRDEASALRLAQALERAGVRVLKHEDLGFAGLDSANLCNRGATGAGVQIEIALGLRERLFDPLKPSRFRRTGPRFVAFVAAIREGIA